MTFKYGEMNDALPSDYRRDLFWHGEYGEFDIAACASLAAGYFPIGTEENKWFTLGAVIDLVASGYLEVGDLTGKDGYESWDMPLAERLLRIQDNWAQDVYYPVNLDTWFLITPKARSYLEGWRRQRDQDRSNETD